jgi:hypothetical protein
LNKTYGTKALASDQIILRAEAHFLFRSVDRISPMGFAEKIPIFEIRCTRECASESEDSSATSGKESTRCSMPEISRTRSSWWHHADHGVASYHANDIRMRLSSAPSNSKLSP